MPSAKFYSRQIYIFFFSFFFFYFFPCAQTFFIHIITTKSPVGKFFCLTKKKSLYRQLQPNRSNGGLVNLRLATGDDDSDWGNEEDDEFDRKKCLRFLLFIFSVINIVFLFVLPWLLEKKYHFLIKKAFIIFNFVLIRQIKFQPIPPNFVSTKISSPKVGRWIDTENLEILSLELGFIKLFSAF